MDEPREIGDWKNISTLGSGGFGVVSLWEHKVTKEKIAIKKCRWYMREHIPPNQQRRWTQEVEMLRDSIRHENIAAYKKIPEDLHVELEKYNHSGLPFLPMEYCTKGNLRHFLSKQQHMCGLPEDEVVNVLKDLSSAVAYLHRLNITHRDIKPENVVLHKSDSRPRGIVYKLIDLGYAKELGSQVASFVGTLPYLAPEIFCKSSYTKNVDYWSFGILAFEIVCGIHPFLPKMEPVRRFEYLQKKTREQICLYMSAKGDLTYSEKIFSENHINPVLRDHLQEWLKSMLDYNPSRRGVLNSKKDVFQLLNEILSVKILTVFSVYNFQYFYYECTPGMDVKALLEKDSEIPVGEQILFNDAGEDVPNCLDEAYISSLPSMMSHWTLIRKSHMVKCPDHTLPPIVKNLMANPKKEFTWQSLYIQIGKSVHYIHKETTLMDSLLKSNCRLYHYIKNCLRKEALMFERVKAQTERILVQIEVHKGINLGFLKDVVVKNGLREDYKKYKQVLWRSRELVENFNAVIVRHCKIQAKEGVVDEVGISLENDAEENEPEKIYKKAVDLMTISNHETALTSQNIVKVLSTCFQKRYKMTTNLYYSHFVRFASKVLREIDRLINWMSALEEQMQKIFTESTAIQTEILKHVLKNEGKAQSTFFISDDLNAKDLIEDNTKLRFDVQSVMSRIFSEHREHSLTFEDNLETPV